MTILEKSLRNLLNEHGAERLSGTPDFVLAGYLKRCLDAFDWATNRRDQWWKERHPTADAYFERCRDLGENPEVTS